MYEGSNPSALRSQNELANALLRLMSRESFSQITITMMSQEAQISRQTFYQLFKSKEDVVRHLIMREYSTFESEMVKRATLTLQQFAELTFAFFDERRAFIELLVRNNLQPLLQEQFQIALAKILSQFRCEADTILDDTNRAFIAGGLCAMILYQAEHRDNLSIPERASRFANLFTIHHFIRI